MPRKRAQQKSRRLFGRRPPKFSISEDLGEVIVAAEPGIRGEVGGIHRIVGAGEIGVRVVAEDAAGEAAPIKRHHLGMLGALHDMTIGQNKAVRR